MSVVVEGTRSVHLGSQAWLLDGDVELAWAEKHVTKHPSLRYVLGRYVEADRANSNGHIFDLKQLEQAAAIVPHTPLNLLHRQHYIVGHYMAAEMVYPTESAAGDDDEHPHMEALAAFYRYYFPEEFAVVEKAHKEGKLYYSMECVPRTITCASVCGQEYAYDGRQSPTYCAHLNQPGVARKLNNPQFTGGALIIPPTRPGWKRADITEVSNLLAEHAEQAHQVYNQVRSEMPDLTVSQWETTVAELMLMAHVETEGEYARKFSTDKRKQMAKSGEALPDGSYPIADVQDLANAIRAFGRAKPGERARVKAHIKKRARALGATSKLPSDWN